MSGRRSVLGALAVLLSAALVAGALVFAVPAAAGATAPSAGAKAPSSLGVGSYLTATHYLQSPNGRYRAYLQKNGRFVLTDRGRWIWWTTVTSTARAHVVVRPSGNVVVSTGRRVLWSSATAGASTHARFTLGNDGALVVRTAAADAWTSKLGNRCRPYSSGKRVVVDLSMQYAWMCNRSQEMLITPITSGATNLGDGTPTGTWRVQAKVRNTYLYPASGGAYFVHYWMPYDGAYGMHDSPWQKFAYGSSKYRSLGSHGCVHFPAAAMSWLFSWAPLGTLVHIRS